MVWASPQTNILYEEPTAFHSQNKYDIVFLFQKYVIFSLNFIRPHLEHRRRYVGTRISVLCILLIRKKNQKKNWKRLITWNTGGMTSGPAAVGSYTGLRGKAGCGLKLPLWSSYTKKGLVCKRCVFSKSLFDYVLVQIFKFYALKFQCIGCKSLNSRLCRHIIFRSAFKKVKNSLKTKVLVFVSSPKVYFNVF